MTSPTTPPALAVRVLEEILDHAVSADRALSRLYQQRNSGSMERARVGDLVFAVLRHRRRLENGLTDPTLSALTGLAARELTENPFPPLPDPSVPPWIACSLPDWLWSSLAGQWGESQALELGQAMNQPAPTDLRVNRLKIDREALQTKLASLGVSATPLPDTPDGLRLTGHPPVTTLEPFHQGLFEVQDKGSQWIAPLLQPRPGDTVVDLCAGGGGKTLHLATLMANRGRIIAADTDAQRLGRLRQRLRRSKTNLVRVVPLRHEGDPQLKPWVGKADGVLIDAPCSGSGTIRRRPELKWQLTPEQVNSYSVRQSALLNAGARLVRPGGRLVYATCSLFREENQAVVESFLNENQNFQQLPAMRTLAAQGYTGVYCRDAHLLLTPHVAGCDGFFAALFQKEPPRFRNPP
ncbi:MAG: RsmB/NOP family class I SAM-dependent RNA methyltransferase [Magnetococcales bacterium]|nr:RsmB/NOP family class I SAM-dependent RNA methyltransferase [Magnetococcales bacterium]